MSQCSPCAPRTSRRGRNPAYGAGLPRVTRGGPAGQTNPQVRGGNRNHNDKQNCNQNDSRLSNKTAEYWSWPKWGGWDSHPRPADNESSPPAVLVRALTWADKSRCDPAQVDFGTYWA